jgi:hypothetical protein
MASRQPLQRCEPGGEEGQIVAMAVDKHLAPQGLYFGRLLSFDHPRLPRHILGVEYTAQSGYGNEWQE